MASSKPYSQRQPRVRDGSSKKDPSKITKERITDILEDSIDEFGKVARNVRQHSNSRDILLKAAKKTASLESTMDATLMNLRMIDGLLDKALDQANTVGRSMETTTQALNQIHYIILNQ